MPDGIPAASSLLVGRQEALAALEAALDGALAGDPRVVLVTGEPGIGKSRLLREAVRRLPAGTATAEGYALPGQGLPPLFAVARSLDRSPLDLLAAAGIPPDSAVPLETSGDRFRVLDACASLYEERARAQPLVLVLDDLQWAGRADWDVVAYVARVVRAPFAVLIGARDEHLWSLASPAGEALAELARNRLLVHVHLPPLDPGETRRLSSLLLGGEAAPGLLAWLDANAGGNPFAIEELIAVAGAGGALVRAPEGWALDESRAVVPATVQLALEQRLAALPPGTGELLRVAAVAGRRVEASLLALAGGVPGTALGRALAPALRAGLLVGDAGGYAFRHDLVRDRVLATIPDPAPVHARVAAAIERSPGARQSLSGLAALAHHYGQAGAAEPAARAALAAAAEARRVRAIDDALVLARQAAQIAPAGTPLHREALEGLGLAALEVGEYPSAEAAYADLVAQAGSAGDTAAEAAGWLGLGLVHRRAERPLRAVEALESAVRLLRGRAGQEARLATALIELATVLGLTVGRYAAARAAAAEALDLARALGDGGLETRVLLVQAQGLLREAGPEAVRPILEPARALAIAAGDHGLAAEVCASLSNAYYWTGHLRRAHYHAARRLELATAGNDVFGLRHAHSWLALLATSRGDWAEARSLLAEAEPVLSRLPSPEPVAFLRLVDSLVALRLGDFETAFIQSHAAIRALEPLGDATVAWYAGLLILACVRSGRTAEAEAEIAAQEARIAALPPDALPSRSARCALGLAYAELGDAASGAACEQALRPFAGDFHWSPARLTLAVLARLRGDPATALDDLATAEELARQEGLRPDLGFILAERASVLGRGAEAQAAAREARGLFRELGMAYDLARLDAAFPPARKAFPAGLSGREVEVLQLVAAGCSNREIAERLVLSERTVVNHISHIFAKTGVENRAAAAGFAFRHGLA